MNGNNQVNTALPFATHLESILKVSQKIAYERKVSYIGTEFIINAMLRRNDSISRLLSSHGVTLNAYEAKLQSYISTSYKVVGYTPNTRRLFNNAEKFAYDKGCGYIAPEHLLFVILDNPDTVAYQIVSEIVDDYRLLINEVYKLAVNLSNNFIGNVNQSQTKEDNQFSIGKDGLKNTKHTPYLYDNTYNKGNDFSDNGLARPEIDLKNSPLYNFGFDLTEKALCGRIDPVIGRDKEIDRVIQTLSKRTKSNPLLIGEPGVGKSAVIEGLALRIAKGEVPQPLKNKILFSLDFSGIIAGAKFKGEFEERLKSAIDYVESNKNIILFIDEIHTIALGGDGMGAGDILKPSMARDNIQIIGATTVSEYRKYIEKDAALARRFQVINVEPPKIDDCIEILNGLKESFEKHHGIDIKDSAIRAAVTLSERYITDRFLPDKAIDLIDEASAKERLLLDTPPQTMLNKHRQLQKFEVDRDYNLKRGEDVHELDEKIKTLKAEILDIQRSEYRRKNFSNSFIDEDSIAKVVSEMTGIPVSKLTEAESQRLMNFESILHKRVVGQELAVETVSKAIRRAMTCIKDPQRPIGSFIFVGPTGVGKTELSKALSEALFQDENALIRIDMSEYMEKASVSKLIGAPPGYVGYDEEGQLTEKVRMKPYSVVLFDEIEKAHVDVFNIMLQILDDGRLTDSKGRTVDFKNTVIIMTSNEGASDLKVSPKIGFGDSDNEEVDNLKDKIMSALKKKFRPEFLNRLDDIVIFRKLTLEECGKVCDIQFESLKKRMSNMSVDFIVSDSAKSLILKSGYDSEYGARPLKRAIARLIENPLSEMIIKGDIRPGCTVTVIDDDGVDFLIN